MRAPFLEAPKPAGVVDTFVGRKLPERTVEQKPCGKSSGFKANGSSCSNHRPFVLGRLFEGVKHRPQSTNSQTTQASWKSDCKNA